jgi:phosphatidylserine/phosphatidylglycerophosphate/cardiolipin synthase-like enzyme
MISSSLFNQDTFYKAFIKDLKSAQHTVVIESPFITMRRVNKFALILEKLMERGVRVIINTKPFEEHNSLLYDQVVDAICKMQGLGIEVYMTIGHHRKLAIIDDDILWEGSLNILSQNDSCEIMRRIKSKKIATDTFVFINLLI